ncbi:MAG: hypothetical protein MPJ24_11350 [Pirellulaceae bacterium]|nr:hypothetical protein [Pirellulaceae bacterium]
MQQRTLLPQTIQKQSWQEGDSQQLSLLQNDWPSHKPAHHPIDDHSAHGKSTFGFIPTTKDLLPPVHRDNFLKQSLFTEKLSFKIVGDGVLPRIHMTKFSTLKELLGPRGDFSQLP